MVLVNQPPAWQVRGMHIGYFRQQLSFWRLWITA